MKGLPSTLVNIHADLEFNDRMCRLITKTFKYFKGIVEGNGHSINVLSNKVTSLFSSIYYSVIKNLKINNIAGSRGLLLADDISHSTFQNVHLTGMLSIEQSMGGFTRTTQNVTFEDCTVNLETKTVAADSTLEQKDTDPTHFGAFIGVDLGGTKFVNCRVSGDITSEVRVGGFCAHAKGTIFENCSLVDLTLLGKREVGFFAGRVTNKIEVINCDIIDSSLSSSIYAGFVAGRSVGDIHVDSLITEDAFINPAVASSFVGGIAGTSKKIDLRNSQLSGGISGSFILAGVCPDVEESEVHNNVFNMSLTASGYKPMMTHAYKLVRNEFLTSREKDVIFNESCNKVNINIIDLSSDGYVNPFKESIL